MTKLQIGALDIEITLRCNLACPYCYMSLDGKRYEDMPDDTIRNCIDLLIKYPVKKQQGVRFYGGEPLLVFDKIKSFVGLAEKKGLDLKYTIMSNGTIITSSIVKYCKDRKINIQRSIDGCPDVQEMTRPGSIRLYEKGTKLLQDYNRTRRMTVTPQNAKYLLRSIKYFQSQGFKNAYSPIPDYGADWTEESILSLIKSFWQVADFYIEKFKEGEPFYFYHFAREAACRFSNTYTQFRCGAGKQLYAVSWDGYVFLCHRFTGYEKYGQFCYGHIESVINETAKGYGKEVRKTIISKEWNEQCKTCIAQYGCEKGCYHSNYTVNGNLTEPPALYCRIKQAAAKIIVYIDSELRDIDPEWWRKNNPRREAKNII